MCMCGEWMVMMVVVMKQWWKFSFALLKDTYLSCTCSFLKELRCSIIYFFSLRWVSCTPNSTVGHLSIFTSCLTLFLFWGWRAVAPFYFLVFLSFFSKYSSFLSNKASGSKKIRLEHLFHRELLEYIFLVNLEMEMSGCASESWFK